VARLLTRQAGAVGPIVLVPRSRVEEMVGPMGGSLRMKLGVEDLDVRIDNDEVKLMIRFGFHTDALCDVDCTS
jgi:hypothetical protein